MAQSYVDVQDALKQNKIPATGTNASTPGDTVVTYTDTAGTIGERGIYDGSNTYSANDNADDLITAGAVQGQISGINTNITNVNNQITNITNQMNAQTLESIDVPSLTCANQGCTLYQVTTNAGIAHKLYSCTAQTVATDCPSCGTGTQKACENSICTCVKACIAQGSGTCSVDSDCCTCDGSRFCESGICGCNSR